MSPKEKAAMVAVLNAVRGAVSADALTTVGEALDRLNRFDAAATALSTIQAVAVSMCKCSRCTEARTYGKTRPPAEKPS